MDRATGYQLRVVRKRPMESNVLIDLAMGKRHQLLCRVLTLVVSCWYILFSCVSDHSAAVSKAFPFIHSQWALWRMLGQKCAKVGMQTM